MKKILLLLFIFISFQNYSQEFQANFVSKKNNQEWSKWENSNVTFKFGKNEDKIVLNKNGKRRNFEILKTEKNYTHNGNRVRNISFKCETSENGLIEFILEDHILKHFKDKKQPEIKLGRFRIYVKENGKEERYNVFLLI